MKNVFTLFCCLSLLSFTSKPAPKGYKIGDKVADFKLKGTDDKEYSLSKVSASEGYIIIFTSNSCPQVKKYESRIAKLHKDYASQGFSVIAINSNSAAEDKLESAEESIKMAKSKKWAFTYLIDETSKVSTQFGATHMPQVYLLDKNFIVKYIGAIDDNVEDVKAIQTKYVENAILALKAGKTIENPTVPVDGCPIKKKGVMNP